MVDVRVVSSWVSRPSYLAVQGPSPCFAMWLTTAFGWPVQSYRWARQYGGPDVRLYHSEHNIWNITKARPVVQYLIDLRNKGVRVDGMFLQVWQRLSVDHLHSRVRSTTINSRHLSACTMHVYLKRCCCRALAGASVAGLRQRIRKFQRSKRDD